MLHGVRPLEPVSFAGAAIVVGSLRVLAGLIPVRRAASLGLVEAARAGSRSAHPAHLAS